LAIAESQLYPILHKLELDGLIEAVWMPQEGKPARKVYSITPAGLTVLDGKRKEWNSFSNVVSNVLAPKTKEAGRG
jgi:PadR family transcriptional regulator, regulatory protein PadR